MGQWNPFADFSRVFVTSGDQRYFKLLTHDFKVQLHFIVSCRTRSSNRYQIGKSNSRTNIFKYSYWNRYTDGWNALPSDVVDGNDINKLLYKHFNEL